MLRKALILLLIAIPVLVMGCTSPTPTHAPTAVPPGVTATPAAGSSPTATLAAGSKVLYNETTVVPAGSYITYKMTLDYQVCQHLGQDRRRPDRLPCCLR